jgi:signal transduction histidine kinase
MTCNATSRTPQGILDGLTAHICVLDANGMIVAVNRAWRDFAAANLPPAAKADVGADYFAVCEAVTGEEAVMAREAVRGLRAVLQGELPDFSFEYPCHSPETQRWFLLQAARLADERHPRMVVAHVNITERKQAEEALQAAHALLERRVQERTAELAQTVDDLRREVNRRREAERVLREQALQLRDLTAELTLVEQRERQRLAQLLHDGLQQWLVAARLRVASLGRFQYPDVPENCREIAALLEQAIASSRSLSAELSPPILYSGGFLPALGWLARWMRETHHLTVALQVGASVGGMDESTTLLLFQAVRELLFNVVKHAGVQEAVVEVTQPDGQVCVTVTDQGKGFDPAQTPAGASSGLGLAGIRRHLEYLGGTLEISSTAGEGSRFTLTVPLNPNQF